MSRDINPFGLRMPPDLNGLVEKSAKESGRSKNAEIVHRLWQTFEPGQGYSAVGESAATYGTARHIEDWELHAQIVELVDETLEEQNKTLDPSTRAHAYKLLYERFVATGDKPIQKAQVIDFLKIVK